MLSWKNQWKGIHIVEGIFPFQKQGGEKKYWKVWVFALQLDSHSQNLTPAPSPAAPGGSLPRCCGLKGGELISWFLRGTNITQSFCHRDQVFTYIHWLQAHILADTTFPTFVSFHKLTSLRMKRRETLFTGEGEGPWAENRSACCPL